MYNSIYELEKAVKNNIDFVNGLFSTIKKQKQHIDHLQTRNERQPEFYRFKIIKNIMKLICLGLDEQSACQEVANNYKGILKAENIAYLWKQSRHDRNALNLYSRIYMAKKMRLAGFKISEIAGTMNLSTASVRRLLNSDAVLD